MPLVASLLVAAVLVQQAPVQTWEKTIAPNLVYRQEYDPNLPRVIHVVRFTPGATTTRVTTDLAGGTINEDFSTKGRLTPTQIQQATGAAAVINGDFFSFDHGSPIGLMVREGELINTPYKNRIVFAWGPGGAKVATPRFDTTFSTPVEHNFIDAVNQPSVTDRVYLYSKIYGTVNLPADSISALLSLPGGKLSPSTEMVATIDHLIADRATFDIPDDKVLLVARGVKTRLVTSLRQGDEVRLRTIVNGIDWTKMANVIGGGPNLVRNGTVFVDAEAQGFNATFTDKRHPRTAIGRTAKGDIVAVAVEGRLSYSSGATLGELAQIMLKQGCVEAMNLDGGGSTALNIRGVTVNMPSDKVERPVVNGVLFFDDAPRPTPATPALVVPAGVTVGEKVVPQMTIDGQPVPSSEVLWGAQGAGWIDQGGNLRALAVGSIQLSAYARGQFVRVELMVAPAPSPVPGR